MTITLDSSDVLLAWQHVAGFAKYEVWRSAIVYFDPNDPASGAILLATIPAPTSNPDVSYADVTAEPGVNYFYVVLGVTEQGAKSEITSYVGMFHFTLQVN